MKRNKVDYRKIWESVNGIIPTDENDISYQIHHKDGNPQNNNIDNLMCVSVKEHYEIHLKQGDFAAANALKHFWLHSKEFGWSHSDETKLKISESLKSNGYTHSDETRKLIALNNKGMLGKTHSDETKRKMSESAKGLVTSKETKQKQSEAKLKNPTKYWEGKSRKGMKQTHPTYTCPHCEKVGKGTAMFMWHFDNCKKNNK